MACLNPSWAVSRLIPSLPTPARYKAPPSWCSLGCRSRCDGRIHHKVFKGFFASLMESFCLQVGLQLTMQVCYKPGLSFCVPRNVMGECHLVGDQRWAGAWGINADFTARTACSIMSISSTDILVGWSLGVKEDDGEESSICKDKV